MDAITESEENDFHRGESSQELSPGDAVTQFVANRSQGVIGEVESTVVLANGLTSFKNDAAKLKSFLDGLCEAKALSQAEAADLADNKSASRVSKLTTVAEYRDSLLDPRICSWLSSGYSTLYEFVRLIKEVEKGQEGLDRVAEILSECDGEISRSWLEKRRKKLRSNIGLSEEPEKASDDVIAEIDPIEAPSIQPGMIGEADANAAPKEEEKAEPANRTVTALLITATDEQVARFGKELADGTTTSACVKVSGVIDANAVLLIDVKADTLLSMSAIIGSLGFSRCVQVGLLSDPAGHDITSSRMMAVFVRGNIELATFKNWQSDVNPAELAGRMLEGVGGRHVNLFADVETAGWESIVGDANWQR